MGVVKYSQSDVCVGLMWKRFIFIHLDYIKRERTCQSRIRNIHQASFDVQITSFYGGVLELRHILRLSAPFLCIWTKYVYKDSIKKSSSKLVYYLLVKPLILRHNACNSLNKQFLWYIIIYVTYGGLFSFINIYTWYVRLAEILCTLYVSNLPRLGLRPRHSPPTKTTTLSAPTTLYW